VHLFVPHPPVGANLLLAARFSVTMHYFDAPTEESARLHPSELVGACMERDAHGLLLDHGALSPAFFDLSSGVAGDLVQKLTNYAIRTAAVVPDPSLHSAPFREFARELDHSRRFRFFERRDQAVEWLSAES
jgi:hypothetical protein